MKIAILGGSFNPLHLAHQILAENVIEELGYDKILFVPSFLPPHKMIKSGADANQRLEMVNLFCKSRKDGAFVCESCEIDRGGISYTSDTIDYIKSKYGKRIEGKPGLIMGEEVAAEFNKWHKSSYIAKNVDFIITPRIKIKNDFNSQDEKFMNLPAEKYSGDSKAEFNEKDFGYKFTMLSHCVIPLSSTEIRQRIANGKNFEYLVPKTVFEYINQNELYKND